MLCHAPTETQNQLDTLVRLSRSIFAHELTGIYLHGSLAMGCFNPARSDLDLLFVLTNPSSPQTGRRFIREVLALSGAPHPLELSVLTEADLRPWRHPTPFDLHYSEEWRGMYVRRLERDEWQSPEEERPTDPDLAAHITVVRERGVALHGPDPDRVFPVVPRSDYIDSLLYDLRDIADGGLLEDPVYGVLNMCRVLCYLRRGCVCSKEEGGTWATEALPEQAGVIRSMLLEYRGAGEGDRDPELLRGFSEYMERLVRESL